jgi:hypothetical protein
MRETRVEREAEICATHLVNKTKCMSTNGKKRMEKIVKKCSIYH